MSGFLGPFCTKMKERSITLPKVFRTTSNTTICVLVMASPHGFLPQNRQNHKGTSGFYFHFLKQLSGHDDV